MLNIENYKKLFNGVECLEIKGLNSEIISKLKGLKIKTIMDLLYFFPKNYEDRTNIKNINHLKAEENAVVYGRIIKTDLVKTRTGKTMFKASLRDETGIIELVWFQMPYLKNTLKIGMELMISGKVKRNFSLSLVNPHYKIMEEGIKLEKEILSEYSIIKGLGKRKLKNIIKNALDFYGEYLFEIIPNNVIKKYKILGRKESLMAIHYPKNQKLLEEAKRRFAIEELFILEMGIVANRYEVERQNVKKYELKDKKDLVKTFLKNLNFELTGAQKKVITQIYSELNKGKIVNRLIQGDVGSGKTIVSIILLLYMVENNYQGVFMAPTEILAVQHYLAMVDELLKLGIKVEILTGSIKGKKREKLLSEIKNGLIDIVVGTHALIEDNVKFKSLGLIVIDEQHRFGVMQRKKLRKKGVLANLLVMSATPIPRSLALSIYGDLDVSIIDELPPGRKPIRTKYLNTDLDVEKLYDFIKKKVKEGRQTYIVCPLVEESEKLNLKSVTELYEYLKEEVFLEEELALLHGRVKNTEKEETMRLFKANKINILISTTVIEVGVDVPNASIMVIMDSERFGLSQLHQLRGRVGRGEHSSYCFLISKTQNEISLKRMEVMEETTDGFKIAEEDLKLRQSGEIFGTRQSGLSDLKFIDIVRDIKTIEMVKEICYDYLDKNDGIVENKYLKLEIENKFSKRIEN